MSMQQDQIRQQVRARYGGIARNDERGCGSAPSCCGADVDAGTAPEKLGYRAEEIGGAPDGAEMGLGCGNPTALDSIRPGETVLDLGSGGGFDCFLAARQIGPGGRVIGVDMTPEMLSKARANAEKGGYTNVEFRLGEIEALPVADKSVDLILSNCVINLSPDKHRVFREAFRVLKPGGRLAVTDIVAVRKIPQQLLSDLAAFTGCVAGAATVEELRGMLEAAGLADIEIKINPASTEFINEWLPEKRPGDYVASAAITARKPETGLHSED